MFQSIFQNNLDQRLVVLLVSQRSFIGIEFFKIISFLGNWQFLLPIIFAVIILLYIKRNRRYIIPFLLCGFILFIAMVGAIVVTVEDTKYKLVKQQDSVNQAYRVSENSIFNFKIYQKKVKKLY